MRAARKAEAEASAALAAAVDDMIGDEDDLLVTTPESRDEQDCRGPDQMI